MPEAEEFVVSGLKFFPLAPILPTSRHLRQITDWLNLGNGLSENETEAGALRNQAHGSELPDPRFIRVAASQQAAKRGGRAWRKAYLPGDGA
jgi:hypothetical protein